MLVRALPRIVPPPCRLGLTALAVGLGFLVGSVPATAADPPADRLVVEGTAGPGVGKKVVLVSGDEEYRSEEALTQLAQILATRHGFRCVVLYAIGEDGTIDPGRTDNIPGTDELADADLMILFTRFRNLPDAQIAPIDAYLRRGGPVIALRTATHAFQIADPASRYKHYDWKSTAWEGGFGKQLLGETWHTHHGKHGSQSTLGVVEPGAEGSPYLRGVAAGSIYGPTDVYGVRELPPGTEVLVRGQVLTGMAPTDPPLPGEKNDPMMPLVWVKPYAMPEGKPGTAFVTTMGASQDLLAEGVRRMLVNAAYILTGLESKLPPAADVALVGEYHPRPFKFGGHRPGVRPVDRIGSQAEPAAK